MKLVNYRCKSCEKDHEELYNDSEWEIAKNLDTLGEKCECGGTLVRFDFKNNPQVWKFLSARN